jgi:hypothetical protein
LNWRRKKNGANLQRIPKKLSLGSQIRYEFGIRDPGVKKAPDPGSRIQIRNTVYTRMKVNSRFQSFFCSFS